MYDTLTMAIVACTFLLAGLVKGVIGLGLPTVSLALLTVALDLPQAMALLLVPSFVTNIWQGAVGGQGRAIVTRLWPFLFLATATVGLGGELLTRVDHVLLAGLLGGLLAAYAAVNLAGWRPAISPRQERWAGPLAGIVNGVLTGMTGSFVVPGVMFLQAIGLPRDMLIQAMGIFFSTSTLALAVALKGNNLLSPELGAVSAAALAPAIVGMVAGTRLRKRLSEQLFRRVFFVSLLLLGAYIIVNASRHS